MNNIGATLQNFYSKNLLREVNDMWRRIKISDNELFGRQDPTFMGRYETLPTDLTNFVLGDCVIVGNTMYILEGLISPSLEQNPYIEKRWGILKTYNDSGEIQDVKVNGTSSAVNISGCVNVPIMIRYVSENEDYSEDDISVEDLSMVI